MFSKIKDLFLPVLIVYVVINAIEELANAFGFGVVATAIETPLATTGALKLLGK